MSNFIQLHNQRSPYLNCLRDGGPSCCGLSASNAKILSITSGIFLILGGISLLMASLFLVPQSLTAIHSWQIGSWVGTTLLLSGGTVCILFGALKGTFCCKPQKTQKTERSYGDGLKATDSVRDYDQEYLKKIANHLIIVLPHQVLTYGGYEVQYKTCEGGPLARSPRYPESPAEIEEFNKKIPNIVLGIRKFLEDELNTAVPISQIKNALKEYWVKNPPPLV